MCTGDGGGPLACKSLDESDEDTEGEIYYLAGIVTSGVPGGCGQKNKAGIYEDVVQHVKWIKKQMKTLKIARDVYA